MFIGIGDLTLETVLTVENTLDLKNNLKTILIFLSFSSIEATARGCIQHLHHNPHGDFNYFVFL